MGKPMLDTDEMLHDAIEDLVMKLARDGQVNEAHITDTPRRFVKALGEMFSGCYESPIDALSTVFPHDADEMIHVENMTYFSMCAHHLLPFHGTAHFAYIPDGNIVGLSKIPRLLEVYSRRPQVQEELTSQIVDTFMKVVKPRGCGLMIKGRHLCCSARGVRSQTSVMRTTALRGNFKEEAVKSEFLATAVR